jgi:hypothetical protein
MRHNLRHAEALVFRYDSRNTARVQNEGGERVDYVQTELGGREIALTARAVV